MKPNKPVITVLGLDFDLECNHNTIWLDSEDHKWEITADFFLEGKEDFAGEPTHGWDVVIQDSRITYMDAHASVPYLNDEVQAAISDSESIVAHLVAATK